MSSSLVDSPSIGNHRIQRSDKNRALVIDALLLKFSPTEYLLLKPLLSGQAVSEHQLVQDAFSCEMSPALRENLDKHIDKIRSKLRPSGLDVRRVTKYGYILLAIDDDNH